jgi:hypothetical protein
VAYLDHFGGGCGVLFLASVNDIVGKVLLGALGRGSEQGANWKELYKIGSPGALMYVLLLPPNTPQTSPRHAAPICCGRPPHCSWLKRLGTRARLRTALPTRSRKTSRPIVKGVREKRARRRVDLANILNINVCVLVKSEGGLYGHAKQGRGTPIDGSERGKERERERERETRSQ